MGDREQPRQRAAALGPVARKRGERRGECLRRQVCRQLAVACAAQEEGEDGIHPPAVEEPERLGVASPCHEQRLIVTIVISAHDYYIVAVGRL